MSELLENYFDKHEKAAEFVADHAKILECFGAAAGVAIGFIVWAVKCLILAVCFFWVGSLF